jgi:hypothetical protein
MATNTSAPMDEQALRHLLGRALLAPSSHNTQPWIFETNAERIRLFADRTRALPANDPDDRELTISCGCALFNLRAAAAERGWGLICTTHPDPRDEDLLADARIGGKPDPDLSELSAFIDERHTYRKAFEAREVPSDAINGLSSAAESEGAWLEVLRDDEQRFAAADLVAEGDASQWADPSWRRELAAWMHPWRSGDGLTLPWLALPVARVVVRTFDMGNGVGANDRQLAEASPVLAVLGTDGDTSEHWLSCGQALARVLLRAVALGLQASYLNQPVQVARLRPKLQNLCTRAGYAQVLLRIGYPHEPVPASPRRPLSAILRH